MDQLWSILYVGSAINALGDADLQAILAAVKSESLRLHLTGLLLYHDGLFMEYIEGQRACLMEAYKHRKQNATHYQISEVLNQSISYREFDDWLLVTRPIDTPAWMGLQSPLIGWYQKSSTPQIPLSFSRRILKMFWMCCLRSIDQNW